LNNNEDLDGGGSRGTSNNCVGEQILLFYTCVRHTLNPSLLDGIIHKLFADSASNLLS